MIVLMYFFILLSLFLMAMWFGLFLPIIILIVITIGIIYFIRSSGMGLKESEADLKKIAAFSLYVALAVMWISYGIGGWLKGFIGFIG